MDKQSSPHIPNNWTSGIDYANYPNSIFYLYDQPTIIATIGLSLATAAHVGIVFSTITAISILIYIRLIYIIYFTEKLWSRPAYRLIVNKGVFDILYLFGYFIAGWCSIFDTRINYWLIKIIGALMLTIVGGFPMTLLLALNRILQMVFIKYYVNRVFSDCLLKLYLVICWLIALLMLALFASPLVDFIYFPLINFWQIVTNVQYPALNVINYIVEYAVIFTYGTTGVIYFMLLKNKLEVDEIRLTFQLAGTVLFGLISASWNLWVLTASTLATTYMHIIVASILNICVPGVDPFLYSIFNQTIRRRMVPLWKKNTVEVRFNV